MEFLKECPEKLLHVINKSSKIVEYQMNMYNQLYFYTFE
jgi:hypothetical protein